MTLGRLIQPFVEVDWGGEKLTEYDVGGSKQPIVTGINFSLSVEDNAPQLTFDFVPSPIGFDVFTKCKKNKLSDPITVTVGYKNPNGESREFKTTYKYSGNSFTTGLDQQAQVTAVAAPKGGWSDAPISYTMDSPITLKDLPEFLQGKCGGGCKGLNFSFVGGAAEDAAKIKYKGNVMRRTPHLILSDQLQAAGMKLAINDSAIDGSMIVHYPEAKKGELDKDKPNANSGEPKSKQRNVFLMGPGLLTTLKRTQEFVVGPAAKATAGESLQTPTSDQRQAKSVIEPQSAPQADAAAVTNPQGTTGPNNVSTAQSSQPDGITGEQRESRADAARNVTTKFDVECWMVPYLVGIKPRDIVAVPSLGGDYIEDWVVTDVTYTQQNTGEVMVSIQGVRTYAGKENLLDGGTISALLSQVKSLNSTYGWHDMYWTTQNHQGSSGVVDNAESLQAQSNAAAAPQPNPNAPAAQPSAGTPTPAG